MSVVHLHNTKKDGRTYQIFVLVVYGRGSVLLWWCSDTLCTSDFVDDVIFSYNGPTALVNLVENTFAQKKLQKQPVKLCVLGAHLVPILLFSNL